MPLSGHWKLHGPFSYMVHSIFALIHGAGSDTHVWAVDTRFPAKSRAVGSLALRNLVRNQRGREADHSKRLTLDQAYPAYATYSALSTELIISVQRWRAESESSCHALLQLQRPRLGFGLVGALHLFRRLRKYSSSFMPSTGWRLWGRLPVELNW